MKIKKSQLIDIIKEEINEINSFTHKLLSENIFRNNNRLLPDEWNDLKRKYLKQHRNAKVVSGKSHGVEFEAIVDKSQPKKALIKYIPKDDNVLHNMSPNEYSNYLK